MKERNNIISTKTSLGSLQGTILPLSLLFAWEISLRLGWLPTSLIASPSAVFLSFKSLLISGDLWAHIWVSSARLLSGFIFGGIFGILYGIAIGVSRRWEQFWMPTFLVIAPIPIIAWIPLLIILFGVDGARFGLVALGSFFIVLFGTVGGIRNVDEELVEMARMYGKTRNELVRHILFPSALPTIFHSLRTAMSMAWVLLIMAEIIASSRGLGWLLWDSRNFGRSDDMIVAMIIIGVLGKLADSILVFLSLKYLWWKHTFKGE